MKFWVGVTNNSWFKFLAKISPDEVNFWSPGSVAFGAVQPGDPFLFKLHSPYNYIVGGGRFVEYFRYPLSLIWDAFGIKNGAPDFGSLFQQLHPHFERQGIVHPDPEIGCIVLSEPFFFDEKEWIPTAEYWSAGIRRGKTFNTGDAIGAKLWKQVEDRLATRDGVLVLDDLGLDERRRVVEGGLGAEYRTRARLGQGAFRMLVTDAYQRRCAITGERTLPVLQAAHIKPCSESGPHRVDNGLLLRADLHILLDRGYLTLADDLRIEVSRRIKEDFENGEQYYGLHGARLVAVPRSTVDQPSPEFVRWHNQNKFLG